MPDSIFNNSDMILIVLVGFNSFLAIVFTIMSFINGKRISNLSKKYKKFMQLSGEGNIEKVLNDCISEIREAKDNEKEIVLKINSIERTLNSCVQKVAIERYCAFEDVGGDLSFALALLDGNNDGITINSIYTREGSNVYAKKIVAGKSKNVLSSEEQMILDKAIKSRAE